MAEQAGGGTRRYSVPTPAAGARQFRASCWCGARGRGSQPRTRAASGLRPGTLRSPARSWLTIGGHVAHIDESAARRRKENAAAERRKARRPASWAGDLRRSGDRSARETDHRVRRSAPAPVGALLPSFSRERKRTKGTRRPAQTGRWCFGCLTTETDCRAGKARRASRRPRKNGGHASLCPPYGIYVEGEISAKPPAFRKIRQCSGKP